jgi:8-hydroxy-5-deazaflavin:NADPH oxidoreductase
MKGMLLLLLLLFAIVTVAAIIVPTSPASARAAESTPFQSGVNMKDRIVIIGSGVAGTALQTGLSRAGYEVQFATKGQIAEAAAWADVIVLAVPFGAVREVARELETVAGGKTVIDVTNSLTPDFQLAVGYTTSGAEELQKALPRAHVVKAFNTVFADHMSTGQVNGEQLTAFVAGDNEAARKTVLEMARAIGFDPIDAGPLKNARSLEYMAFLNIQLSWALGNGPNVGFKFIHQQKVSSNHDGADFSK